MECRECNWWICDDCCLKAHRSLNSQSESASALARVSTQPAHNHSVNLEADGADIAAISSSFSPVRASGRRDDKVKEPWQVARYGRSAKARACKGQSAKDGHGWAVVWKGGHEEEEDAHTDATASTGLGCEEVASIDAASDSGKEQCSRAASAQPPQVSEAEAEADVDREVEDVLADDGWTQVRKRERREPSRPSAESIAIPKGASVPIWGLQTQQHEGPSTWDRSAPPTNRAGAVANQPLAKPGIASQNGKTQTGEGAKDEQLGKQASGDARGGIHKGAAAGDIPRSRTFGEKTTKGVPETPARKGHRMLATYKVGIRQDETFNLVKRLLVPSGGHIKRIAMATGAKLTVRAEGSADMEGPLTEEITDEPLMICIRTAYASSLDRATVAVEDLIRQIHEDYRAFCWNRNFPEPELSVLPGEMSSW
jgi:hypothetical protein